MDMFPRNINDWSRIYKYIGMKTDMDMDIDIDIDICLIVD